MEMHLNDLILFPNKLSIVSVTYNSVLIIGVAIGVNFAPGAAIGPDTTFSPSSFN
jgi:hypothetical protein